MRKKNRKILGVGTNDLDYEIFRTEKDAEGKVVGTWLDPCYHVWSCLLGRLYSKRKTRMRNYSDCTLYNDWYLLSNFHGWFYANWIKGWYLDKDILIKGNREYGPDTCRFIPDYLNTLLTDCAAARGEWPIGVYKINDPTRKIIKRFMSRCCDATIGKRLFLGTFNTPEEAHKAWQKEKINQINKAIDRFRNEPVGYRKDIEEALLSRIEAIDDDMINNRETFKL